MASGLDLLSPDFILRNALYGSVVVGLVAPIVGLLVFMRNMVFLGVALPQISMAGIAGAIFWHATFHRHGEPALSDFVLAFGGASLFTTLAMVLLAALERKRGGMTDGWIGALYAVAGSLTILLLASDRIAEIGVVSLMKGEIVSISDRELLILVSVYVVVAVIVRLYWKELVLIAVDRDLAMSQRKRVWLWDLLLFAVVGITISLGVLVVGPLVLFGFMVVPPMIAARLVVGTTGLTWIASAIGGGSALGGFYAAQQLDWPTGPTDVALIGLVLAAISGFQIWRGRRRRSASPSLPLPSP
jgi:ABC-type Mn2+/Zn2+ transport system permease subunit